MGTGYSALSWMKKATSIELLNWECGGGDAYGYHNICLVLGKCTEVDSGSLWANVRYSEYRIKDIEVLKALEESNPGHQCPDDHILSWPGMEKSFRVQDADWSEATFTLAFTLRNGTTLTLRRFETTGITRR